MDTEARMCECVMDAEVRGHGDGTGIRGCDGRGGQRGEILACWLCRWRAGHKLRHVGSSSSWRRPETGLPLGPPEGEQL